MEFKLEAWLQKYNKALDKAKEANKEIEDLTGWQVSSKANEVENA